MSMMPSKSVPSLPVLVRRLYVLFRCITPRLSINPIYRLDRRRVEDWHSRPLASTIKQKLIAIEYLVEVANEILKLLR
jgi:hypothetical protein